MNEREHFPRFVAGDVMTGRGIDQIVPHPGDPTLQESYRKDTDGCAPLAKLASRAFPGPGYLK